MLNCSLEGVFYWESTKQSDIRGIFHKILPPKISDNLGNFNLKDAFISHSKRKVVRGMHLQVDEFAGGRIIHLVNGEINDVLVDLRSESITKGKVISKMLSPKGLDTLFVPANVAHGFEALTDASILYLSERIYESSKDTGFNPITFDYEWQTKNPIISERDLNLPNFNIYK
jgi:dTDP-4-dehydrorhamnose 3,5-epimerase